MSTTTINQIGILIKMNTNTVIAKYDGLGICNLPFVLVLPALCTGSQHFAQRVLG